MYEYKAEVTRVVDGDTIDVLIDLGFGILKKERVRLARINAPESRTRDLEEKARGLAAKDFLIDVFSGVDYVILRTFKSKGKYGRFVADVLLRESRDTTKVNSVFTEMVVDLVNVNDMMVEAGHAVYHEY